MTRIDHTYRATVVGLFAGAVTFGAMVSAVLLGPARADVRPMVFLTVLIGGQMALWTLALLAVLQVLSGAATQHKKDSGPLGRTNIQTGSDTL